MWKFGFISLVLIRVPDVFILEQFEFRLERIVDGGSIEDIVKSRRIPKSEIVNESLKRFIMG